MQLTAELAAKQARLDERLRALGKTLVAYSGGVDSAVAAVGALQSANGASRCSRSSGDNRQSTRLPGRNWPSRSPAWSAQARSSRFGQLPTGTPGSSPGRDEIEAPAVTVE